MAVLERRPLTPDLFLDPYGGRVVAGVSRWRGRGSEGLRTLERLRSVCGHKQEGQDDKSPVFQCFNLTFI